uniref:B30.2/SPRY domain-containing protein n=1 Tax=Astyanax mexicanus TaxID=7994 RepID=A0A8B9GWN0_ASTMX
MEGKGVVVSSCDAALCFLSSAPVTLDPNTAEDSLHLSEDLTEVEDTDGRAPVPRNPERFDLYQCVLGSEGFNSGTHCWDVQVGDSEDWDVGVVSASVRRSGDSFWGSAWTLGYEENSNEYCVHRPGEPDHFFTPDQPVQSVRVQLDWEAGKLTFTDLQTNADLHSINHAFTEKLLPLFRNLSHAPLKILAHIHLQALGSWVQVFIWVPCFSLFLCGVPPPTVQNM